MAKNKPTKASQVPFGVDSAVATISLTIIAPLSMRESLPSLGHSLRAAGFNDPTYEVQEIGEPNPFHQPYLKVTFTADSDMKDVFSQLILEGIRK